MLESVRRLQEGGVLDDFEVRVLHDQINILVKSLVAIPLSMPTPDPENLFLNIHWVNNDKKLATFLKDNSEIHDFDLNDFIIQDDEEPDAIYLIISGMVRIVHGQYREETEMSDIDMTCEADDDDDHICDYASTGIVVGEMGCLVGENAHLSVICETAVQTYQIPVEVIREAYSRFPKLLDTLWSVVGMKIAVPLLMKDYKFQGFTPDELRRHLQSSYVANFNKDSEFQITSDISEVILLDGTVMFMGEFVNAPALIQADDDAFSEAEGWKTSGIQDSIVKIQDRAVLLIVKRSKKEAARSRNTDQMEISAPGQRTSSRIIRQQESRSAITTGISVSKSKLRGRKPQKETIQEDEAENIENENYHYDHPPMTTMTPAYDPPTSDE